MAEVVNDSFMALPAGSEDPSLGDNRIREFKLAWKERMEKEHFLDLNEAGAQPRQGLHKAGSAVTFYQDSAPTTRNGVALGSSDAGLLWLDSGTKVLYVYTGSSWSQADLFYESINTSKTYGVLGLNTMLILGSSGAIDVTAGASIVGSQLTIICTASGGTVKYHSLASPITPGINKIVTYWDGTNWAYESSAAPIRLLLTGTPGSGNIVTPMSGIYTYVLQGGGGAGGGADLASTIEEATATGGGGGAGTWVKYRRYIAGGLTKPYVCGAGGTGVAGATGGDGTTSSWNGDTADYGRGGIGANSSTYGALHVNGSSGEGLTNYEGVIDWYQPNSPNYYNGTHIPQYIVRQVDTTYYYNYYIDAPSGVASKYGAGGRGGYVIGVQTTTPLAGVSAAVPGSGGLAFGAGGGGALNRKNTTAQAGGAGVPGIVYICLGYELI